MQEGAYLPLFVVLSRQFLQPQLRHEERASFCVRDRDVEATRKEEWPVRLTAKFLNGLIGSDHEDAN